MTHDGGKGKVPLFRKPAIWEGGGLTSQRPSSLSRQSQKVLKGMTWKKEMGLSAGEAGAQAISCMLM